MLCKRTKQVNSNPVTISLVQADNNDRFETLFSHLMHSVCIPSTNGIALLNEHDRTL